MVDRSYLFGTQSPTETTMTVGYVGARLDRAMKALYDEVMISALDNLETSSAMDIEIVLD